MLKASIISKNLLCDSFWSRMDTRKIYENRIESNGIEWTSVQRLKKNRIDFCFEIADRKVESSNWKMKSGTVLAVFMVCCCYVVEILSASIDLGAEMQNRLDVKETPAEERTFTLLAFSSIMPLIRKFFHKLFGKVGYWRLLRLRDHASTNYWWLVHPPLVNYLSCWHFSSIWNYHKFLLC